MTGALEGKREGGKEAIMSRRGTLLPTEVPDPSARGWSRRLRYPDWPDCCCLLQQQLNEIGAIQTRPQGPQTLYGLDLHLQVSW